MAKHKITVDELASMFGLTAWEVVEESLDYDENPSEWSETYSRWHTGVRTASEQMFAAHRLRLVPAGSKRNLEPSAFYVLPEQDWVAAANEVRKTINGVGIFYYASVRAFCDSGPDTPRSATLSHLHWLNEYPSVYGTPSAQTVFNRAVRW